MFDTETSYDEVPYTSFPFSQTSPQYLRAIGQLFGMNPTKAANARILELGCAAGGNLIPHAVRYPNAFCKGVDLSSVQIQEGQDTINALGLSNCVLEAKSITDIDVESETPYDYIICHGVFSWVPDEVQKGILEVVQKCLAPEGLAVISYNTMPGWHSVGVIRDMMQFHGMRFETPERRVKEARGILKFMSDGLKNDQGPYARVLRNETELLSKQPDYYLLHEHLESDNRPIYFHEFMEMAHTNQLQFVGETSLNLMFPPVLPEKAQAALAKITNLEQASQYMDFIRNQRFRHTILTHQDTPLNRNLKTDMVKDFWLEFVGNKQAPLTEAELEDGKAVDFAGHTMRMTSSGRLAKAALSTLVSSSQPLAFTEWVQSTAQTLNTDNLEALESTLFNQVNTLRLVMMGLIRLHSEPVDAASTIPQKPKVDSLVTYQLQKGMPLTTRNHQIMRPSPIDKLILEACDGTRTVDEIGQCFVSHVESGAVNLKVEGDDKSAPETHSQAQIEMIVNQLLERFTQLSLFLKEEGAH